MRPPIRTRWLSREPGPDADAYVFCLPYSGCGASMYRQWPRTQGPIEFCPIQLPGRENRLAEPAFDSYEDLAAALIPHLLPYLDRPFAFFGHCASALIGYETSVQLLRAGLPLPARLFVSSQVAPHQGPHGRFLSMSEPELADELATLIVEMGGRPRPDVIELAMGTLLSDIGANRRYRPAEPVPLPVPVTALSWDADEEVAAGQMLGWQDCGQVEFHQLSGGHYRFVEAPEDLLAVLEAGLAEVIRPQSAY